MTRFVPLVVGMLVAAVCGRLGVWQLDRLEQRQSRNAILEARMARPALRLDAEPRIDAAADGGSRAVASGTFDFDHQIVVMARSFQGAPGVHVVTPLVVDSTVLVLVERGWVASANAKDVDLAALAEPARTTVTGVLLEPPRLSEGTLDTVWPRFVRAAAPSVVRGAYGLPTVPLVLRRTELPAGVPPAFRPVPLPDLGNGPHLSYAVQWFSFGLIALVGGGILSVKRKT